MLFENLHFTTTPTQLGECSLITVVISPSGYGPARPVQTSNLKLKDGFYFIETAERQEDEITRWQRRIDQSEAEWHLNLLKELRVPTFLESPTVADGDYVEVIIEGLNARLTIGWWSEPPNGCEALEMIVHWMSCEGTSQDDDQTTVRLTSLTQFLVKMLATIDRNSIYEGVINNALRYFRELPSPDEREGVETGLDFLAYLHLEGDSHPLWEIGIRSLRDEIYSLVSRLDEDSQIALLLPMSDDTEDLARDRDINEWAKFLRSETAWLNKITDEVLSRISQHSINA